MRGGGALLSVIIVHDETRVDDSRDPAQQGQDDAEEETRNATGHEHRQRRKNDAEKISQRFHNLVTIHSSSIRNLRSPDSTINRDKADAAVTRARRFVLQCRSPCICRFGRCAPLAFPGAAWRLAPRFPAGRAPPPSASRSPSRSSPHNICGDLPPQTQSRHLLQNDNFKRAVPAEDIHAYIASVVSGEPKINACVSEFEIATAHLRQKL